ncbi:putative nucleotidyltransferase [compost metagenome]
MQFTDLLEQSIVLECVTGSTAYRLNGPNSDIDIKSIVNLPLRYQYTLHEEFETLTTHEPDKEYHSFKKFVKLAAKQNPTILEMLHVEPEFVLRKTAMGQALLNNANMFISAECAKTYGGYARDQLMRIKNGLNRAGYKDKIEFLSKTLVDIIGSSSFMSLNHVSIDDNGLAQVDLDLKPGITTLREIYQVSSELVNATKNFNKAGSKNKRAEGKLEKHAMHLIRLLITCIELLTTGKMNVARTHDRGLLLNIRNGKHTWDEVFDLIEQYEKQLAYARDNTVLPQMVNMNKINEFYTDSMIKWVV